MDRSLLVVGEALRKRINALLRLDSRNYTTPRDFFDRHAPCLCEISRPPYVPSTDVAGRSFTMSQFQTISDQIEQITAGDWSIAKLEETMGELALELGGVDRRNIGADDVREEAKAIGNAIGRYLRWALTGGQPGPGVRLVMIVLGRDVTLQRLQEANAEVKSSASIDASNRNAISAVG